MSRGAFCAARARFEMPRDDFSDREDRKRELGITMMAKEEEKKVKWRRKRELLMGRKERRKEGKGSETSE